MASRILVVEDEPLIGLDIVDALTMAGFEVEGPATSVKHALALLEQTNCSGAILDVNLGRETAAPIADYLRQRGLPFVVLSGYSTDQYPTSFSGAPCLSKPVDIDDLIVRVKMITAPSG